MTPAPENELLARVPKGSAEMVTATVCAIFAQPQDRTMSAFPHHSVVCRVDGAAPQVVAEHDGVPSAGERDAANR